MRVRGAAEDTEDLDDLVALIVWRLVELRVREQRVQDAEVCVAERDELVGEVEQVADYYIEEDAQVVGVEVFVGGGCGEEEVEEFED